MQYLVALLFIVSLLKTNFIACILYIAAYMAVEFYCTRTSAPARSPTPKPPSEESIARLLAVKRKQVIAQHGGLLQDHVAQDHVKNVGHRLTVAASLSPDSISFCILNYPEPRAMALPPGLVLITTGLYRTLRSESGFQP